MTLRAWHARRYAHDISKRWNRRAKLKHDDVWCYSSLRIASVRRRIDSSFTRPSATTMALCPHGSLKNSHGRGSARARDSGTFARNMCICSTHTLDTIMLRSGADKRALIVLGAIDTVHHVPYWETLSGVPCSTPHLSLHPKSPPHHRVCTAVYTIKTMEGLAESRDLHLEEGDSINPMQVISCICGYI